MIGLFVGIVAGAFLTPLFEPFVRDLSYFLNTARPNRELEVSALLESYFRGIITEKELKERLAKHGFDEKATDMLITTHKRLLTLEELLLAKWHGIITEKEFLEFGKKHGFTEEDIKRFEAVRKFYPSPSDFIRFAVREVFNPTIVEKYGLDEEFPTDIIPHVKKVGMEEEILKWYWRAHWDLPSPSQAYEMLHRLNPDVLAVRKSAYEEMGLKAENIVTDLNTVRDLLKTADYPAYWRDRLIAIAYSPLTRVDLRRIYELGLITDEELIARLQELGYTKKDAELMANFYKKLRHEESFKIALSKIEKAYKIRKINRNEFKELLLMAGFREDEAEFLISLADADIDEERKERLVKLLTTKLQKGLISVGEFKEQLRKMGIPDEEIEYWAEVALIARENAVKTLTTTQIRDALLKGLISEDEALDLLIASNWLEEHARLLIKIWTQKTEAKASQ